MPKYKRLTTDTPEGMLGYMVNMTYAKDNEIYLKNGEFDKDISLVNFCVKQCKDVEGCEVEACSAGDFELDCDCIVAWFNTMAIGYHTLHSRLKEYEDANVPRPIEEWHEDDGNVLWWKFPIVEPPYCGSMLDCEFTEDYYTHFTKIIEPELLEG